MSLHLDTERLAMRSWSLADVGDSRELVAERGGPMPAEVDIRHRIATQLAATTRTELALLPMRRLVEGDFIGRASVEEPELAFEFFRHVHGQGYATEAARAVLDAATASGRSRFWSTVRTWNAPFFRVLDKLGFARDHISVDDAGELVWLTRSLP